MIDPSMSIADCKLQAISVLMLFDKYKRVKLLKLYFQKSRRHLFIDNCAFL